MPLAPKYMSDGCAMKIRQQKEMLNIHLNRDFQWRFERSVRLFPGL